MTDRGTAAALQDGMRASIKVSLWLLVASVGCSSSGGSGDEMSPPGGSDMAGSRTSGGSGPSSSGGPASHEDAGHAKQDGGHGGSGGGSSSGGSSSGGSGGGSSGGGQGDSGVGCGGMSGGNYEGFGAQTPGGGGCPVIHISQATSQAVSDAFNQAKNGHATIVFDPGLAPIHVTVSSDATKIAVQDFVTVEGNGATLIGDGVAQCCATMEVQGHDVIVRNLRFRNSTNDNLRAQKTGAYNVVFDSLSVTGGYDDGVSIGYGAHDVTLSNSFLAGNSRSIFMKYNGSGGIGGPTNTTNVSMHHLWIQKQYIRGPIVDDGFADIRNILQQDYMLWGSRFEEANAGGNVVNSVWWQTGNAPGKAQDALYFCENGICEGAPSPPPSQIYTSGNIGQGNVATADLDQGTAATAFSAPSVTTLPTSMVEAYAQANAGCMVPNGRDAVDEWYIQGTQSAGNHAPVVYPGPW